jgi:hypothetical protein
MGLKLWLCTAMWYAQVASYAASGNSFSIHQYSLYWSSLCAIVGSFVLNNQFVSFLFSRDWRRPTDHHVQCKISRCITYCTFSILSHTFNKQIFALNTVINTVISVCPHSIFSQALTTQRNGRQRIQRMIQTGLPLWKHIKILATYIEKRHIANRKLVRFEVFTAVTMKNAVIWDVAPCTSCVNRHFGGTYRLHLPPAHAGSLLADFSTQEM